MDKIEPSTFYKLYVKRKSTTNRSYETTLSNALHISGVWYIRLYYKQDDTRLTEGETGYEYRPLDTDIFEVVRYEKEKEQNED
jgi:hypothetical protein|nr:MAG TPA: hypothetical protein [Caudoviricetes sp.]